MMSLAARCSSERGSANVTTSVTAVMRLAPRNSARVGLCGAVWAAYARDGSRDDPTTRLIDTGATPEPSGLADDVDAPAPDKWPCIIHKYGSGQQRDCGDLGNA